MRTIGPAMAIAAATHTPGAHLAAGWQPLDEWTRLARRMRLGDSANLGPEVGVAATIPTTAWGLQRVEPMNLSSRRPQRKSILVVDDDEETRTAIYEALSPQYRVILAVDGLDGYEKASEPPPPDLIIADISMPRLDGLAMARRIRENEALRRVPIIFVAGHMPPARVLAESRVDPFSCLPKPTDLDVLERAMKRLLN